MKIKLVFITALFAGKMLFAQQNQIALNQKSETIERSDSFEKVFIRNEHQKLRDKIREKTINENHAALSLKSGFAATAVNITDSLALVALYNSTDGPNWIDNTNWLTGPVSTWHGITVESGRVTSIIIHENNMSGAIPAEIGQLTNLQWLYLYANQLTGSIPAEIGQLTNLYELNLYYNQLTGTIPSELYQISNLTWLDLGENQLTGTISVDLVNLKNLHHLLLNGNQFTGTIPAELEQLTDLQFLQLSENQLTGDIPLGLFQLTNLVYLNLGENQLTGTIPSAIGQLTNLKWLFLGENLFTGAIPAVLWQMTNLSTLALHWNQFTGSIPVEISQLTNLDHLFLLGNQLTGTIPVGLGQLTKLKALFLGWNQLDGSIPAELGQLSNLVSLTLNDNQLQGNIPAELGQLSDLTFLALNVNQLTGAIPKELGQLSNLTYLLLYSNQFSGKIPTELGQLSNLYRLSLGMNKLTDAIPTELWNLSNLQILEINSNLLSDEIPAGIEQLTNLEYLYLNDNLLTGSVPEEIEQMQNLLVFDVHSNQLDDLPDLSAASFLDSLMVSENRFTFEDIEHNMDLLDSVIFIYQPQDSIGETQNITKKPGENLSYKLTTGGSHNKYQWYHNGAKLNTQTSETLEISNLDTENSGKYYCQVLNDKVPGLVLTSRILTLKVQKITQKCRYLIFKPGWNIFSTPFLTLDDDIMKLFEPLILNKSLVKIQDDEGKSLENWGIFGDWQNKIGKVAVHKGYKLKATVKDSVLVCGLFDKFPFPIPLTAGWNIMGFPQDNAYDAKKVIQQLVDRGTLVKVQDEAGNTIEDWGIFGGWKNNIGDFFPGKGFKVKVNAKDTLWIYESYPTKSTAIKPEQVPAKHFQPRFEGNGVDHMNINLVSLPINIMNVGDELAVFDGASCVGAVTIMPHHLDDQSVALVASAADNQGMEGFSEGNLITIKLWNSKQNQEFVLEPEIIKGTSTFTKYETTVASMEKYAATGLEGLPGSGNTKINCYPNPFSDEVTIEINLSADALVRVEVLNQLGQRMKFITTQQLQPRGLLRLNWDGCNSVNQAVSPGVYYVRIGIENVIYHRKIVLLE